MTTDQGSSQPLRPTDMDGSHFAETLAPAIIQTLDNRLTDLRWFRTDWQRGGALTGRAQYRDDQDRQSPVVIKFPVPPRELRWLQRLQTDEPHFALRAVPQLYASDTTLAGYDMAWVVMEQLNHGPLNGDWQGAQWSLVADALARFYQQAAPHAVDSPPREEDWPGILSRARAAIKDQVSADAQHWNDVLKKVQKKLKKILSIWDQRDVTQWCHGDAHLGNAMTQVPPPDGPAYLFDLAEVHPGHWVEDAVYFEHLYWGKVDQSGDQDPVKLVARARKAVGLKNDDDWPRLAQVRRVLLAASAPAYRNSLADPIHMKAALGVIEKSMKQLNL